METDRLKVKMERMGLWPQWAQLRTQLIMEGMTEGRASQRAAKVLMDRQAAEGRDAAEIDESELPGGADPIEEMDWVAEAIGRDDEQDFAGAPSKAAISQLKMCRRHPALQLRLFTRRADLKDKAKAKRGGFNEFREIDLGGTLERLARIAGKAEREADTLSGRVRQSASDGDYSTDAGQSVRAAGGGVVGLGGSARGGA